MKKLNSFFNILVICIILICFSCNSDTNNSKKESNITQKKSLFKLPKTHRDYWPTSGWKIKKPGEVAVSEEGLKKMEEYVFNRQKPEKERKGIRTDSVLIIKNGYLIYEKYGGKFQKDSPHLLWSISKSFVNALYGIATKEGLISIDKFACEYYPALKNKKQHEITINHLLQMSSGLFSNEGYESSPLSSTVIAMLYSTGKKDMAEYTVSLGQEAEPGTYWEYASPTANLLMGILKKTMSREEYNSYPWKKLFGPLGMNSVTWEQDVSGTFVGSSYIYMTPRDLAKFGYLYLNGGKWDGQDILPAGWVEYTTTIAPAFYITKLTADQNKSTYGALFWLNQSLKEMDIESQLSHVPEDAFMGVGHWGQYLVVIPSLDMVIVYTGDNRDGSFVLDKFLKRIIDSINSNKDRAK